MPTADNMASTLFCQDTDWKLLFSVTFSAPHSVFDFEEGGSGPSCLTNDIYIKPSRSVLSRHFQEEINPLWDPDCPLDILLFPVISKWASYWFGNTVVPSSHLRNCKNYQDRNNIHSGYMTCIQTAYHLPALQSHSGQKDFALQNDMSGRSLTNSL